MFASLFEDRKKKSSENKVGKKIPKKQKIPALKGPNQKTHEGGKQEASQQQGEEKNSSGAHKHMSQHKTSKDKKTTATTPVSTVVDQTSLSSANKGIGSKRKRGQEGGSHTPGYNFEGANFLDHFETPLKAYQDIESALTLIARDLGVKSAQLRIYDPFYCDGSVKTHLAQLGFENVYNENEDFYTSERYANPSMFDVVVTNPPYSGEHKEKCMNWLRQTEKPFFCLLWAFAATKQWYTSHASSKSDWFIAPKSKSRYDFRNPSGKGMDGGSPYSPLWICNTQCLKSGQGFAHSQKTSTSDYGIKVYRSLADYTSSSGMKKRLNPKQRRQRRKRMMEVS